MEAVLTVIKWIILGLFVAGIIVLLGMLFAAVGNGSYALSAMREQSGFASFDWAFFSLLSDQSEGGLRVGIVLRAVSQLLFANAAAIAAFRLYRAVVKV